MSAKTAETEDRPAPLDLPIDCDSGIDDAIALSYLAGEALAGLATFREVVAVRGNLDASRMLDRLSFDETPILRGAHRPLTPLATELDATAFHGWGGLGGNHDEAHPDRSRWASSEEVAAFVQAWRSMAQRSRAWPADQRRSFASGGAGAGG